jgi:ubiquitin-protein ligase
MRRLGIEFKNIAHDAELVNNSLYKWHVSLNGPDNTPYKGGTYLIEIVFPDNYPDIKPDIRFLTKIYHPNIDPTGLVCIKDWSSSVSVLNLIDYTLYLLSNPNFLDPVNISVKKDEYEERAKRWCRMYAQ